MTDQTRIQTTPGFSLAETCGPVAWGGGRWPNQDWIDGELIVVTQDHAGPVICAVSQPDGHSGFVTLKSSNPDLDHQLWADRVLGVRRRSPNIADPVIRDLMDLYPGMRPLCNMSLFDAILTAIIGQSISVQAAAVTERKLCAVFAEPVEWRGRSFWPLPTIDQIASSDSATVRLCGVTQKRAEGIVNVARIAAAGNLIDENELLRDTERGMIDLIKLPMIGRWTAESILLWGYGVDDSYPVGDVALLRAVRLAYARPTLTLKEMDSIAEEWRPGRSWAARWLWINLFGPAPSAGVAR